jgi:hypothetical protein
MKRFRQHIGQLLGHESKTITLTSRYTSSWLRTTGCGHVRLRVAKASAVQTGTIVYRAPQYAFRILHY